MKKIQIFFIVLAVVLLGFIIFISARSHKNRELQDLSNQGIGTQEPSAQTPGTQNPSTATQGNKYDAFATCIKNSGAVFYGAYWCPHCNNQKEAFGTSKDLIPYVECSTSDGKDQMQVCKDKQITGYPTWVFADGSRLSGEVPLETLAQKTACTLPQ